MKSICVTTFCFLVPLSCALYAKDPAVNRDIVERISCFDYSEFFEVKLPSSILTEMSDALSADVPNVSIQISKRRSGKFKDVAIGFTPEKDRLLEDRHNPLQMAFLKLMQGAVDKQFSFLGCIVAKNTRTNESVIVRVDIRLTSSNVSDSKADGVVRWSHAKGGFWNDFLGHKNKEISQSVNEALNASVK